MSLRYGLPTRRSLLTFIHKQFSRDWSRAWKKQQRRKHWKTSAAATAGIDELEQRLLLTVYYVDGPGGDGISGGGNDNTNDGQSPTTPFRTITHVNNILSAGDTVYIRGGEYSGQAIRPANSGSNDNYITYQAYDDETPKLTNPPNGGTFPGTSDPVRETSIVINKDYIKVDGITVDGEVEGLGAHVTQWGVIYNADHVIIQNNTFLRAVGWAGFAIDGGSQYNQILENYFDYLGTDDDNGHGTPGGDDKGDGLVISRDGDNFYNLIEKNIILRAGHTSLAVKSSYNIIRNNYINNDWGNGIGNHAVEIVSHANDNAGYNVFEYNSVTGAGASVDNDGRPQAIKVEGVNQIVRFNYFYDNMSEVINTGIRANVPLSEHNHIYNNTFYNNGGPAWYVVKANAGSDENDYNIFMNNLSHKSRQNPQNAQQDVDIYMVYQSGSPTYAFPKNNKVFSNSFVSDEADDAKVYIKGSSTYGVQSLEYYETNFSSNFYDNIEEVPIFAVANPDEPEDFKLQSGSPQIDAGAFLTKTVGNGTNSNTVTLADARYFTSGFGIVDGDFIKIGSNSPVEITNINYSTGVVTLASNITWSNNDNVSFNYTGSAPDIGAWEYESTSPPTAPSGLSATAISSTEINLSWTDNSSDETGFEIDRSLNGSTWMTIAEVGEGVTFYGDTGLSPNTLYYYRVRATRSGTDSSNSSTASDTTDAMPAPLAPSGLNAMAVSAYQVKLTWNDNSTNETGFKIEKSTNGTDWTLATTADADATEFTLNNLDDATLYHFRVRATNPGGDSANSNTISDTTQSLPAGIIDFDDYAITSFETAPGYDADGTATPIEGGATLVINGNAWKKIAYSYTITANTVIEFDYQSTTQGEIQGIALEDDNAHTAGKRFDLYGTQTTAAIQTYKNYSGAGAFVHYSIPVGTFFTGTMNYLVFVNDDDDAPHDSQEAFRNVRIYESTTAPNAPSSLSANALSTSQIDLAWTDNSSDEEGFKIERSLNGSDWTLIDTVGEDVTTYSDNGLTHNTLYYYRVSAFNGDGDSSYSNSASDTTDAIPLPAAPTGLKATTVSVSQINLSWTDASTNETMFKIERSLNGGDWSQIATVADGVSTYSDTGLSNAEQYFYRVRAANDGGNSAYTNSATDATAFNFSLYTVTSFHNLDANGTTSVLDSGATMQLNGNAWKKIAFEYTITANTVLEFEYQSTTEAEIQGIALEDDNVHTPGRRFDLYGTQASAAIQDYNTYSGAGSFVTYTIPVGQFYTGSVAYLVFINDDDVAPQNSQEAFRNVRVYESTTAPDAPSGLVATAISTTQINLDWSDQSNNEFEFEIERSPTGAGSWTTVATLPRNSTGYSDTGLTADTTYYYRVRSTNPNGNSSYSSNASDTTLVNAPTAPSGLSATTASMTQINLAWTDNSANETGFKIDRSTNGIDWSLVHTTDDNETSWSDTGLTSGIQYYYRVRATNSGGDSANTATDSDATYLDFDNYSITSFASEDGSGSATVQDSGATLQVDGNAWKKIAFSYTITANTVIEFDFKVTTQAEIQGIALEDDNVLTGGRRFDLYGTQTTAAIQTYKNYNGSGSYVHYTIPVGSHYTGMMEYFVFVNDDDNAPQNGQEAFRNLKIYEAV